MQNLDLEWLVAKLFHCPDLEIVILRFFKSEHLDSAYQRVPTGDAPGGYEVLDYLKSMEIMAEAESHIYRPFFR